MKTVDANRSQLVGRRRALAFLGMAGAGAILGGGPAQGGEGQKAEAEDVSPAEDLMREHGVLRRVLMVYREAVRRIEARDDLPPAPLADAARVIREFIEEYHEKLEEDFIFPRFRASRTLEDLVGVLIQQHGVGRRLTDVALQSSTAAALKDDGDRGRLAAALRQFIRMYEPHGAREDTVLFPALRKIVTPHELDALGEDFEKKEHTLFGSEGFERMVERVAAIEKQLGVYELDRFTPKD